MIIYVRCTWSRPWRNMEEKTFNHGHHVNVISRKWFGRLLSSEGILVACMVIQYRVQWYKRPNVVRQRNLLAHSSTTAVSCRNWINLCVKFYLLRNVIPFHEHLKSSKNKMKWYKDRLCTFLLWRYAHMFLYTYKLLLTNLHAKIYVLYCILWYIHVKRNVIAVTSPL